jgi:hypothetical protein
MTPERWLKVEQLFQQALTLAPERRGAFLAEARRSGRRDPPCGRDAARPEQSPLSVPGHALRCGPETSVTSPSRCFFEYLSRSRSGGNVGIPKGFPRGVGRVESRFYGFPCFPFLVISTAQAWLTISGPEAMTHPLATMRQSPSESHMARVKVLKGVAHNVGSSFTSLMNYAGDDYSMGHILRFARESGTDTLTIDLLSGQGSPDSLLSVPISGLGDWYSKMFLRLVQSAGSDRELIQSATLKLTYDLLHKWPSPIPDEPQSSYTCDVLIIEWSGREDSNLRPPGPEPGALPG